MRIGILTFGALLFLVGCIGTDLVDDPVGNVKFEIQPERIAVLVGSSKMAEANYYNTFGVKESVPTFWTITPNTIAGVNGIGQVNGKARGQALLFASYASASDSIRVTVVQDETEVAYVDISTLKTSLSLGESVTVMFMTKNINELEIPGGEAQWFSTDESVLTINQMGIMTGQSKGSANVYAVIDGVYSNEIEVAIGEGIRTGTFQSANGYEATGMVTLETVGGNLILKLGDDFMTDFALGTFIYLANNNSSGTAIRNEGIELGEITTNGSHTFNVTQNFPDVTLSQFEYVIVLCKPASIPFGFAQLD